jgi:hypothetical protein
MASSGVQPLLVIKIHACAFSLLPPVAPFSLAGVIAVVLVAAAAAAAAAGITVIVAVAAARLKAMTSRKTVRAASPQ